MNALVYFIKTTTSPAFLKVGKSCKFKSRLRALRGACPMTLEVIGTIDCGTEQDALKNEKECFARLRRFKLHHEWFVFDDVSAVIVNELLALPAPPLTVKKRAESRIMSSMKANKKRQAKKLETINSIEFQILRRSIVEHHARNLFGA